MTTDNNPVHYRYISQRLTREIVQQHEAARPKVRFAPSVGRGLLSFALRIVDPDYSNPYDMAMRATEAVKDNTGTLDSPGAYFGATMGMRGCKVAFHLGFESSGAQEVAAFFADEEVPNVGRVFVALLGSVTNFIGWRAASKLELDSNPSDAAGMYHILASTLEPKDSVLDPEYLAWDDAASPMVALDGAYRLAYRDEPNLRLNGKFDFLAITHRAEFDVDLYGCHYDVVLLGAPVWVASPFPVPM